MIPPEFPEGSVEVLTTLARATGPHGEVALRRRGTGDRAVEELIVNGAFAMDSTETSSERRLAGLACELAPTGGSVLIGGLGLGYTAHEALQLDVGTVHVVEIEECLVGWARSGVTPILDRVARDSRVTLQVGDIAQTLMRADRLWDAIALDVDNGPDFLIHDQNASLYSLDLLAAAYASLSPGGRLAIWCQGPSPVLMAALGTVAPTTEQHLFHVQRGERRFHYAICTATRPLLPDHPPKPE